MLSNAADIASRELAANNIFFVMFTVSVLLVPLSLLVHCFYAMPLEPLDFLFF